LKSFEYADAEIGEKEIFFAIPSMLIAVGILILPRSLAVATDYKDGIVSIFLGAIIAILFTWMIARLAASFPRKTFFEYSTFLLTKPVAVVLSFYMVIHFTLFTAYEVRAISFITEHYLLSQTPTEVIALVFLLVIIYAVAGDRVGLFRLNLMFLPIILLIIIAVALMNIRLIESSNYFPIFQASFSGYLKGAKESLFSFTGYEILYFYIVLMNRPKKAAKAAIKGVGVVLGLYLLVQITCIGVFGQYVASELVFPTVELAKEVQVPGGFFERFESVFFTVWIMALFNTTAMSYDVAVFALTSIFKKKNTKLIAILVLAPLIYLIAMIPKDLNELGTMGTNISYSSIFIAMILPMLLTLLAKIRRKKA
jgi:spore germination protein